MSTITRTPTLERAALDARQAAALLGISTRHLHALVSRGELPRPVHFGKSARWDRAALESWLRDLHAAANPEDGYAAAKRQ